MTTRLYYDSDALTFRATVIGFAGDPTRVLLDQTAFYPTSGGQPHDTGLLGGQRVLDVIDGDEGIIHVVEAAVPLGAVEGAIDVERRFDFTVQHTAQHLISAIAADRFGWETTSVHFGQEHSTIEFRTAAVSDSELAALEAAANEAIRRDHRITVSFESPDAEGLRKRSSREGPLRIVTIEGIDRSACGGTHLSSLGRIGSIWLRGVERIRSQVRIGFRAGPRLLETVHGLDRLVQQLATAAGSSVGELEELIPRRLAALHDGQLRIEELEEKVASFEAARLLASTLPDVNGVRVIVALDSEHSIDSLRQIAQASSRSAGARFIASPVDSTLLVVAASPETEWHAGNLLRAALRLVGGKGGGTATFAQGTVPTPADRAAVVAALCAGADPAAGQVG